jgi:hypothetical protein
MWLEFTFSSERRRRSGSWLEIKEDTDAKSSAETGKNKDKMRQRSSMQRELRQRSPIQEDQLRAPCLNRLADAKMQQTLRK